MEPAYCGLNCGECAVYLASVTGNTEAQIRLAEEYSTDSYRFSKEDMYCLGCYSDQVSQKMCAGCDMRSVGIKNSENNPASGYGKLE